MAVAAALMMLMALLLPGRAAAAAPPPFAMEGLRGCNTTCGNVSVPYPFGFGPSHCYWPGLDLTCDTSHGGAPRLLLGDGSLRVTDISLRNETVRVMRAGSIINASGAITPSSWNVPFGHGFTEYGYRLSYRNELVVAGCNVAATLLANIGEDTPRFVGGCAAFCTIRHVADGLDVPVGRGIDETSTANVSMRPCADNSGCCRAPVTTTSTPERVMVKWLNSGNHTVDQKAEALNVFVAEEGWIDDYRMVGSYGAEEAPIVLGWSVTRGLPPGHNKCDDDVRRLLCRSENSSCFGTDNLPGVTCQCDNGYDGNPYLPGGCKDDVLPPDKIGLHNCNTTCGDVRVPYPFGTSPGCYWPGFNLTCKARGHDLPRLFLDKDGTLEVVDISLSDSTVRVIHHTRTFNNEIIGTFTPWNDNNGVYSDLPSIVEPYMLSTRNEMILSGCDLRATLYGEYRNSSSNTTEDNRILGSCVSSCSSSVVATHTQTPHGRFCSGHGDGCCHAPIVPAGSTPNRVSMEMLINPNITLHTWPFALISEEGLIDQWHMILNKTDMLRLNHMAYPLVLRWVVKQGLSAPTDKSGWQCPMDVARRLCKSKHSDCRQEDGGFACYCSTGYNGNPYIADGCQEINMCSITALGKCFGDCIKLPGGHFRCQCRRGTHGNPYEPNGCVNSHTGDSH
nr:unnamed protein product [Digitaria exilis]